MNLLELPWLSIALWLPALGALLLFLLPVGRQALYRQVALGVTGATFAVTVGITWLFVSGPYGPLGPNGAVIGPPLQFVEQLSWIPAFGASYSLGLDGINLWLIVLTSLLAPFAVVATWSRHTRPTRTMMALLLLMETALLGAFMSQDMLLFYVFFEAALIPAVLLVGMWGSEGHTRAAFRLFLYTFAGSVLMLIGIIALSVLHRTAIVATDPGFSGTFELRRIVADMQSGAFVLDPSIGRLIFGAFFIAFAVKMALWPFHTWLPDAYAAAPTPVAILLAGVMSKFGAYGLIRFNLTLFPELSAWAAPAIGILAVIGIIYAAAVAFSQNDLSRVIAYASISHMNMIALGIFALNSLGIDGALFQMVAHGVTTAALFLIVAVLYDRREVRELSSFGGLWMVTPKLAGVTLLILLAMIGLPGLSGFVGEFTMMQGVFTSSELGWPFAAGAAFGVILAAAYGLRIFHSTFMGEVENAANLDMPDLNRREYLALGVLAAVVVLVGFFPNLIFAPLGGTVEGLIAGLTNSGVAALLP
ncbi:MAG: NADH-quinone oxidoreductase subunit M [Oscillochloris sp.]|nr:NADH-quinone oxidoreductase subunit M [Oscillochloris sp.]